jgi:hypothetical protein
VNRVNKRKREHLKVFSEMECEFGLIRPPVLELVESRDGSEASDECS